MNNIAFDPEKFIEEFNRSKVEIRFYENNTHRRKPELKTYRSLNGALTDFANNSANYTHYVVSLETEYGPRYLKEEELEQLIDYYKRRQNQS